MAFESNTAFEVFTIPRFVKTEKKISFLTELLKYICLVFVQSMKMDSLVRSAGREDC